MYLIFVSAKLGDVPLLLGAAAHRHAFAIAKARADSIRGDVRYHRHGVASVEDIANYHRVCWRLACLAENDNDCVVSCKFGKEAHEGAEEMFSTLRNQHPEDWGLHSQLIDHHADVLEHLELGKNDIHRLADALERLGNDDDDDDNEWLLAEATAKGWWRKGKSKSNEAKGKDRDAFDKGKGKSVGDDAFEKGKGIGDDTFDKSKGKRKGTGKSNSNAKGSSYALKTEDKKRYRHTSRSL